MNEIRVSHRTIYEIVVVGDNGLAKEIARDDGAGLVLSETGAVFIAEYRKAKPTTQTYLLLRSTWKPMGVVSPLFNKLVEFLKLLDPDRTLQFRGSNVVTRQYERELLWEYAKFVVTWEVPSPAMGPQR